VEKYVRTRQATDDNITVHAHYMLDTEAKNGRSEYAMLIAFARGTNVTRTRLGVTFIRTLTLWFIFHFI
jgi:hypothetical protein